jgi:hypothetical protein
MLVSGGEHLSPSQRFSGNKRGLKNVRGIKEQWHLEVGPNPQTQSKHCGGLFRYRFACARLDDFDWDGSSNPHHDYCLQVPDTSQH